MKRLNEVNKIILHCSASDNPQDDSLDAIRRLHITPKMHDVPWNGQLIAGRGFSAIGYHWIITKDGKCWAGRNCKWQGAHTLGHNHDSLGICLTGNKQFSLAQYRKLFWLLEILKEKHELADSKIYGHYAFSRKPCPNFIVNL